MIMKGGKKTEIKISLIGEKTNVAKKQRRGVWDCQK